MLSIVHKINNRYIKHKIALRAYQQSSGPIQLAALLLIHRCPPRHNLNRKIRKIFRLSMCLLAKDDRLMAVTNRPVVAKILDNDIDPDGNTLKIISVTSPTKNDGTVIINKNGTVTFLPATYFTGIEFHLYRI